MRLWITLPLLILLLACGAGLASMAGYRVWPESELQARIEIQEFKLPASFALDPTVISDELSAELALRAQQDFAIRTLLGTEGQSRVADLVVPRLLNASVIRRLIADVDGLSTVISVADYTGLTTGSIANTSDQPMEDVALIIPGAAYAESVEGVQFPIADPTPELQSVEFGTLEPGATLDFTVWLSQDSEANSIGFTDRIRLGAAGGIDGSVSVYGLEDWFGRSLEVVSWARWAVAAILALTFVGTFAALAYQFVGLFRLDRRHG